MKGSTSVKDLTPQQIREIFEDESDIEISYGIMICFDELKRRGRFALIEQIKVTV